MTKSPNVNAAIIARKLTYDNHGPIGTHTTKFLNYFKTILDVVWDSDHDHTISVKCDKCASIDTIKTLNINLRTYNSHYICPDCREK